MATLRYLGEFLSDQGEDYDVYLDDTDWVLTTSTFTLGGEGFTLNYPQTSTNSPHIGRIIPSTVNIPYIKQVAGDNTLQSQMIAANEERFKIRIDKNSSLFWTGFVLTDSVTISDEYFPARFSISATDGIGRLKDIDYNNAGTSYSGRATILAHIFNCLGKIPLNYFYDDAADEFLKVIVNWYEDNHAVVSTLDPLTVTDFDHSVFIKTDSNGNTTWWNCYDVLEHCLKLFNARMYQSNGVWIIEQINERENATFTEFVYSFDQTHLSTDTGATYDVTVNTASNSARPRRTGGGVFTFYPPLDKVCLTYEHNTSSNLLEGQTFQTGVDGDVNLGNVAVDSGSEAIRIEGGLFYTSQWNDVNNLQHYRHIWNLTLKVGSYYLKRDIIVGGNGWTLTYTNPTWTTNESHYKITTPWLFSLGQTPIETQITDTIDLTFQSPALNEGGDIIFNLEYVNTLGLTGNEWGTTPSNLYYTLDFNFIESALRFLDDGDPDNMETSRKYCVSNGDSDKNTVAIDAGTLVAADGPFTTTLSKLKVYDSSAWVESSQWRVDDTGTAYEIQELIIREILAAQKTPIKRYEGGITGDFYAHSRLTWDSEYFLFDGGTFTANADTWQGRWFQIQVDSTGIDTEPDVPNGPTQTEVPNPGGTTGIGGGGAGTTGVVTQGQTETTGPINGGFVEEIDIPSGIDPTLYATGDTIVIVDPNNGNSDTVTVAVAPQEGDTTIIVEGYIENDYPTGAIIMPEAAENIPDQQLAGEIINEFFTNGTIDKTGYFFKTDALLPRQEYFMPVGRTYSLFVVATEFFYSVPEKYNGGTIENIYMAVATAGTGGNTTIDVKNNGSTFHTCTISSGNTYTADTLTTAETLATGDIITVEITAVSTTAPKGLVFIPEILADQTIYTDKLTYQLNRVITEGLQFWNRANYIPQVPIGYGSVIFSSSGFIDCGQDTSTDITGSLSMSAWVKFDDVTTTVDTIMGRYSSSTGYIIVKQGAFIVYLHDTANSCQFSTATAGMENNKWYHIATTYDGTTAKIYLDGALMDSASYGAPSTVATEFILGAIDTGNYLTGSMALPRLWSRELTQAEVSSIKNKRYSQLVGPEKLDLVSAWELTDIDGTTAPDSHGDNDGTTN